MRQSVGARSGARTSLSIMRHGANAQDDAEKAARKRAALGIAAIVDCDPRTVERALEHGVDAIRTRRLREELRTHLGQVRAAR